MCFEVFNLFTRTILLSGGKLVFSGRRRELPAFFLTSGCNVGADIGKENVADKLMDWITVPEHSTALGQAFLTSRERQSMFNEIDRGPLLPTNAAGSPAKEELIEALDARATPKSRSFLAQVRIVFRREMICLWRSRTAFHMPFVRLQSHLGLFDRFRSIWVIWGRFFTFWADLGLCFGSSRPS